MFKELSTYRKSLVLGVVGILILILGAILTPKKQPSSVPREINLQVPGREAGANPTLGIPGLEDVSRGIASQIEAALENIEGAGKVKVAVFLEAGPTAKFASNSTKTTRKTEEKESGGGGRLITEENDTTEVITTRGSGGVDKPVVFNVEQARIKGVLVVAQGARDSEVKGYLHEAVRTLLDLPPYRIQVVPMQHQ